jgi:P-type conjugative transfer protein TrbL
MSTLQIVDRGRNEQRNDVLAQTSGALCCLLLPKVSEAAINNAGILTTVTVRFNEIASTWATVILGYASTLFWSLATISLVWTGGLMILRRADIQEFFAEFIRFTLTLGFFYWLLRHGPVMGKAIIDSFKNIGGQAMGAGVTAPSGILDLGFALAFKTYDAMTFAHPVASFTGVVLAMAILIFLALIAANLTVQFCAAWIVLYAGCILLGFGGSRWTSDIAIQYYKTVLGIGLSLMTSILLLGVGNSILEQYFTNMSGGVQIKELTVVMVVTVILFLLVDKLPGLMANIVSHGVGHSGIGSFGAGTALATGGFALAASSFAFHGVGTVLSPLGHAVGSGITALQERIRAGQTLAAAEASGVERTPDSTSTAAGGDA